MKIFKYLFIGAILYACTKKPTVPATPLTTGGTGGTGGSSGSTGGSGGTGGGIPQNFLFEFFQKYNANPLPTNNEPYGNDYVRFQFAGWSIISREALPQNAAFQSWIDFKLYDAQNNIVCYIMDKRANYHPNYSALFPAGTDLRSNNHLQDFFKYLPIGTYKLVIKNISPDNVVQNLRLGTQGTGGDIYGLLHEDLPQGATRELTFNVSSQDSGRSYVFNCNVY